MTSRLPSPAQMFRAGLAAGAAVAFLDLWRQAPLLMGPTGLAPGAALLAMAENRGMGGWELPTLFWWWPPAEGSLAGWAMAGAIGSAALLHPIGVRIAGPVLALLYLSFANLGGTFYSFQWDNLIVESLLLAALWREGPAGVGRIGAWAYRLLLLRLSVESGLAKAWFSTDWTELRAMGDYWPTVPLPTPLTAWAALLPGWAQQAMAAGTLAVEVLAPWLMFVGARGRRILFWIWTTLQAGIWLTGNYGVFNWLSVVVAAPLLVDTSKKPISEKTALERAGSGLRGAGLALSLLLAGATFGARFVWRGAEPPGWVAEVAGAGQAWRAGNAWHLFASVDPLRYEVELVGRGGEVGSEWVALPMRYQPPATPTFIAPLHPRVDFRLWFFTLGGRDRAPGFTTRAPSFVGRMLILWCTEPARLSPLLSREVGRPAEVGLRFWRARLTTAGYAREELGMHPRRYACPPEVPPEFPATPTLSKM